MRCADCPDAPNGTRKRPICCMEEGIAARRVEAEANIINRLAEARAGMDGPRSARAAALSGSMLNTAAGSFTPGAARYAAPLTDEERQRTAPRRG